MVLWGRGCPVERLYVGDVGAGASRPCHERVADLVGGDTGRPAWREAPANAPLTLLRGHGR